MTKPPDDDRLTKEAADALSEEPWEGVEMTQRFMRHLRSYRVVRRARSRMAGRRPPNNAEPEVPDDPDELV